MRVLAALADYYKVSIDYLAGRTECKEGVAALNKSVADGHTTGAYISDILSLDAKGRAAVLDYIALQKLNLMWRSGKLKRVKEGPPK